MTATRKAFYDFVHAVFWRRDSSGIAVGQQNPDSLVNGTESDGLAFIGEGISGELPEVSYRRVTFKGSSVIGAAYMGVDDFPEFNVELAVFDDNLSIMLKGGNRDTSTVTNAVITSPNDNNPIPHDVGAMFCVKHQSFDSATQGATNYRHYIFPSLQGFITETGPNTSDGDNPQAVTVSLQPSFASKHLWGIAFGSNEGFSGNKTQVVRFDAAYPYNLTAFTAASSDTTFNVGYTPQSSDVTSGTTTNVFTKNGVATAPTSFSTSTGAVVFPTGSDGDKWVAFYAMNPNFTAL